MKTTLRSLSFLFLGMLLVIPAQSQLLAQEANTQVDRPSIGTFIALLGDSVNDRLTALKTISGKWNVGDTGLLIEAARFANDGRTRGAIINLLSEKTGKNFPSLDGWYRWIWNQDVQLHPKYATFKKQLYSRLDPRFAEYFSDDYAANIRLDEIRWGGVRRDGIPPLNNPETIPAANATFMGDSDVVFGVSFGGKSRAYPKRILAWHEMVKDNVGGLSINGVYCTLCGSMIVYETNLNGKHYELGTSGFLYRSNKMMYDHATKSMWSTANGEPVVGPLVGKGIKLTPRYVVTTTWGQWKADHPDTDVLSLNTGHRRNYGEGVAYNDYFSTDDLMFTVPKIDKRLKNKDEVLIVRTGTNPLAIAAKFLKSHPVYQDQNDGIAFVVVTDKSGANRVYESGGNTFVSSADGRTVTDQSGANWTATEDALVSADASVRLKRLAAHRAFWFGWFADHPDVRLVK